VVKVNPDQRRTDLTTANAHQDHTITSNAKKAQAEAKKKPASIMKGNSSHAQSTRIAAAASSSGLSKQAVANAKQAYAIHAKNLTGSLQASVDTLAGDDEE